MTLSTQPRHRLETEMVFKAINGNQQATGYIITDLAASQPEPVRTMQDAIRNIHDDRIWQTLLIALADHHWAEAWEQELFIEASKGHRRDQSIIELFTQDQLPWEKRSKETCLKEGLEHPSFEVRQAAAFLSGMRGDSAAIPILGEIIDSGKKGWKLRAVRALGVVRDKRCGLPLIKALINDRGRLHREARRALQNLGPLVESDWREALKHPDEHIRWHAARGLIDIGDPGYAVLVAEGLDDKKYAVQWASADALARAGIFAMPAILMVLSRETPSDSLRRAAYHALQNISAKKLLDRIQPLLEYLRNPVHDDEIPTIARQLLDNWQPEAPETLLL